MAPTMAHKRKSDEMDNGPSTPTGSPRKKMKITQAQKQALIDNLQLEGEDLLLSDRYLLTHA